VRNREKTEVMAWEGRFANSTSRRDERWVLEEWTSYPEFPRQLSRQARAILAFSGGKSEKTVSRELKTPKEAAADWCKRSSTSNQNLSANLRNLYESVTSFLSHSYEFSRQMIL
jgi:hypothetical protein